MANRATAAQHRTNTSRRVRASEYEGYEGNESRHVNTDTKWEKKKNNIIIDEKFTRFHGSSSLRRQPLSVNRSGNV